MFAPKLAKVQTKAAESTTSKLAPQRSTLAAQPFPGSAVEQTYALQRNLGQAIFLRLPARQTTGVTGNELCGHNGKSLTRRA